MVLEGRNRLGGVFFNWDATMLYRNKDWLEQKYWKEELSLRQVAELAGCDSRTIRTWMKKFGVPTRNRKKAGFGTYKDKNWLHQKYWTEQLSTVEIGALVDRSHETICLWMDRHNIPRRDPQTAYSTIFSEQQLAEAVQLYESGWGLVRLMKRYGVSQRQLQKNLDRANVVYRPCNRQYEVGEHAFDDLTDERAAYWAGFLYADGCCKNTTLSMGLSAKDTMHLVKLKIFLKAGNPIQVSKTGSYFNARFNCSGIHLSERLKELGIVVGRTQSQKLNAIPMQSRRHWIRGYLDGDGCIYKRGGVSFCGKPGELKFIRNDLDLVLGESETRPIRHTFDNAWYLNYGRGYPSRLMSQYLYKNASIYLDRKRRIILEYWTTLSPSSVPQWAKEGAA